jgi:predicted GNAT superfamily acetyltransferase
MTETKTSAAAGRSPAPNAAAGAEGVVVRALEAVEEMSIGVRLQEAVWGYSAVDTVPEQMFVVAKESGGQVLAAFQGEQAVGFALAFAGIHHGSPYLHSHMVGILPEFQNRGVGRLLKLAQREDALARNIELIEWTFDPLQLRNAHFNLVRLGAVVRRCIPNCYGRTSSPLHAGLPTDRLVAEWWVGSKRVEEAVGNKRAVVKSTARISLPANIREICANDVSRAEEIQARMREQLEEQFAAGRAAVGFEFDESQGSYLLEPYED